MPSEVILSSATEVRSFAERVRCHCYSCKKHGVYKLDYDKVPQRTVIAGDLFSDAQTVWEKFGGAKSQHDGTDMVSTSAFLGTALVATALAGTGVGGAAACAMMGSAIQKVANHRRLVKYEKSLEEAYVTGRLMTGFRKDNRYSVANDQKKLVMSKR